MANFREYSARLASMSGMRRVTATMKMVAASHLHRAQTELKLPEAFATALWSLVPILRRESFARHRLALPPPERDSRVLLIVLSSNRGLCGAFNNTIIREVRRWARERRETQGAQIQALYAGQKGYAALKREIAACMKPSDVTAHPHVKETIAMARFAVDAFLANQLDEVWIAGNRFINSMVYEPQLHRLMPFHEQPLIARPAKLPAEAPELIEPDDTRMLEALYRQWVHMGVYYGLLHSVASEHSARVMAMENATVNLRRMEKELLLLRNRARQAAITNELTEIVSGAESLG
jgi:F-type H+-transporting ATPase subunit gamma